MAVLRFLLLVFMVFVTSEAQRSPYAGLRPVGYPEIENNLLVNRFGNDEPGPIEAGGDQNLIKKLNNTPIDKRPFWFLNWQHYEQARRSGQTYPIRQNNFIP